jgi:actin-related protein
LFLHRLANYYWKGLKENYNCMQKLWSHKFSNTFVPREHGCSPREHGSLGINRPKLPQGTNVSQILCDCNFCIWV